MAHMFTAPLGPDAPGTAELGDWIAEFDSCPAGFPAGGAEAFRGLPGDCCQAMHLGYLFTGEFRIRFADGRVETVRAGEAYRIDPGHTFEATQDISYVEFSPAAEYRRTLEMFRRNRAALDPAGQAG